MANIYGLVDPITLELRYIGYTAKNIEDRAYAHWRERKRTNNHKTHWIRSLWDIHSVRPEVFLVESINENEWTEAECFWIEYYRAIGCKLTNSAIGGKGRIAGTKLTPEHRNKITKGLLKASAEGRFDYTAAGAKRKGKTAWNKGKTYTKSPEAMERYMENPNRVRPNNIRGIEHVRTRTFKVLSPKNEMHNISGLSDFCKERNLNRGTFAKMLDGKISSYRGWTTLV